LGAMVGFVLLVAAAPAGSDGEPDGYALRLPLSVEAGAKVQRLVLPAAVLAGLQTRDGHDVRVFDAKGRAMPIARAGASAVVGHVSLDPMPILGAPDALKVSGVSLRLDGRGAAQVAEVRRQPQPARPCCSACCSMRGVCRARSRGLRLPRTCRSASR
jgi:hypothetical protein